MIPFTLQRLDHAVLRVADLERSIRFYTQVLGCEVKKRRPDLGLVHLAVGDSMLDLIDVTGPAGKRGGGPVAQGGPNMDHFCIRVEPFDAATLVDYLDKNEVKRLTGIEQRFGAEGTGPSIYIADPDGNTVELKGPADQPA
ncbi:MAG: VOC family protein [Burkholderiaceae bacterium]